MDLSTLPSAAPLRLRALIARCLERDVKQRLRDIGEARVEIAKIESGGPDSISGVPLAIVPRVPTWRRALPWAVAAIAVIGAVITAIVAVQISSSDLTPTWTSISAPFSDFAPNTGSAVSPDGRSVAFAATNASGTSMLWVRRLDAQSAREIPATDGASEPFWSPDGLWIGFFKDRKLQKILASGGQPQILADAANPRGAAWSATGVILFVPGAGLGLHHVSSAGGPVERLTTSTDEAASSSIYPSFLPDGKHFLYSALTDGEQWINVGSLDGKPSTRILKAFSRAEYSNGYLLCGSKGALYAQAFDVSALRLSGERMRIVDQLGFAGRSSWNYSFSSSAKTLVTGNLPIIPLSRLTWFDDHGARLSDLGDARHLVGIAVSPDRTKALLEVFDPGVVSTDPWIMQLNSGFTTPIRAAAEGASANSPIWSSDGQSVFYSESSKMRVVSLSGQPDASWPVGSHWPASSSPDGQYVLITVSSGPADFDLMLVSVAGDHTPIPWLQTSFRELRGRFSPDGHTVAYVSDESGRPEVYVQSFPRLGSKKRVSTGGGTDPVWSEDGKTLYFLCTEASGKTAMMAAAIDSSSSSPRRLFELPAGHRDPMRSQYAVFDNGRRFLISVYVPDTRPQVLTVGFNWATGLGKGR